MYSAHQAGIFVWFKYKSFYIKCVFAHIHVQHVVKQLLLGAIGLFKEGRVLSDFWTKKPIKHLNLKSVEFDFRVCYVVLALNQF
jgi:hypothetical protein